jgi:hypothetical protein
MTEMRWMDAPAELFFMMQPRSSSPYTQEVPWAAPSSPESHLSPPVRASGVLAQISLRLNPFV